MFPGCEFIKAIGDVPDEWVQLYIGDLTHHSAHLAEDDIEAYLDAAAVGWRAHATLRHAGNHWEVDLLRAIGGPLRIRTPSDGNCGAHAVHAILVRDQLLAGPLAADNHAADAATVTAVRAFTRTRLAGRLPAVRTRIHGAVHGAPNVFEAGFGPRLITIIQTRDPAYKPEGQSVSDTLAKWPPPGKSKVVVNGPLGFQFDARHSRGAPYLKAGPSAARVSKSGKMESYDSWMKELRSSGVDPAIAAQFLMVKDPAEMAPFGALLKTPRQRMAMSMLWTTAHLAEEWRKKGAVKILRALLRGAVKKEHDLETVFLKAFRFKKSADEGRVQVGLVQDMLAGHGAPSADDVKKARARPAPGQSAEEKNKRLAISRKGDAEQIKWAKSVVGHISDDDDDDLNSSEEQAERRKLKKKRHYSKPYEKSSR